VNFAALTYYTYILAYNLSCILLALCDNIYAMNRRQLFVVRLVRAAVSTGGILWIHCAVSKIYILTTNVYRIKLAFASIILELSQMHRCELLDVEYTGL